MATLNGTNGTKLVWWLIGILGALVLFSTTVYVNKITTIEERLIAIEVTSAALREKLGQINELVTLTRQEQIERTHRFADISNKLTALQLHYENLHNRFNTISERILTINKRLDERGRPLSGEIP